MNMPLINNPSVPELAVPELAVPELAVPELAVPELVEGSKCRRILFPVWVEVASTGSETGHIPTF